MTTNRRDVSAGAAPLPESARLALEADPERLRTELATVTDHRWQLQRVRRLGGGIGPTADVDWRVLPLRSPDGDPDRTDLGGPGPVDFRPTPWLNHLPYLSENLDAIPAPLNAVRLMALGPGAASQPHRDPKYALERGFVRLHLPIVTHPQAVLVLDGVEHCWPPGQLWFGDFSREHQVRNTGSVPRVHTVIDALLTESLAAWFPPRWQTAFVEGAALFNHMPLPKPATAPVLPRRGKWPANFTDFSHDRSLSCAATDVRFTVTHRTPLVTIADRQLTLVNIGARHYRFAGWSEQRTIKFTDDGILLRSSINRQLREILTPSTV